MSCQPGHPRHIRTHQGRTFAESGYQVGDRKEDRSKMMKDRAVRTALRASLLSVAVDVDSDVGVGVDFDFDIEVDDAAADIAAAAAAAVADVEIGPVT